MHATRDTRHAPAAPARPGDASRELGASEPAGGGDALAMSAAGGLATAAHRMICVITVIELISLFIVITAKY